MCRFVKVLGFLACACWPARPNDYVAEIANGGLRATREHRVRMLAEKLFISKTRIRVEYEYLNESNQDLSLTVAFPWPRYSFSPVIRTYEPSMLNFHSLENGKPLRVRPQIKAFLGDREITEALDRLRLGIADFGKADADDPKESQIARLSEGQRADLVRLGALDGEDFFPQWEVEVTYSWKQLFPAGKKVRIAHEYAPVTGGAAVFDPGFFADPPRHNPGQGPGYASAPDPGCPDAGFLRALKKSRESHSAGTMDPQPPIPTDWVKYILTTANTWKGPIGEFELTVERDPGELVTFCWDGPVTKVGSHRFQAKTKGFRPTRELTIYFVKP